VTGTMARRTIVTLGNATLQRRAAPVDAFDAPLRELIADLFETMAAARGVGLAAPQIEVGRRVAVIDPSSADPENARPLALVNPEIVSYSGSAVFEEGCLSVPGVYADVMRPASVRVRYQDETGETHEETFEGIMARVAQHEIDHLEGTLFVYRLSRLRRAWLLRRYGAAQGGGAARPVAL
jgi:peptide deformylase